MGSILVIGVIAIWLAIMAAAALAPLFARSERPADTSSGNIPEAADQSRPTAAPVRLQSRDRIAA